MKLRIGSLQKDDEFETLATHRSGKVIENNGVSVCAILEGETVGEEKWIHPSVLVMATNWDRRG